MRALIIMILSLSQIFPSSIQSCDKFLTEYANPAPERGMKIDHAIKTCLRAGLEVSSAYQAT